MYPTVTPALPKYIHASAVTWIDSLVADLRLRALNSPPKQEVNHTRLAYWRTLRERLDTCYDPETVARFANVKPLYHCSRHWDGLQWLQALVSDAFLLSTRTTPILPITLSRLEEWKEWRADLLICQKPKAEDVIAGDDANLNHSPLSFADVSTPPRFLPTPPMFKIFGRSER